MSTFQEFRARLFGAAVASLVLISVVPSLATAQVTRLVPARRPDVERRDRDLAERVRPFFDSHRPESERVAALATVPGFSGSELVQQAVAVARDGNESPRIRAIALSRVQGFISHDDALLSDVLGWLRSSQTPAPLRRASFDAVESLLSSPARPARRDDLIATLRVLARDPNQDVRDRALKLLAMEGVVP